MRALVYGNFWVAFCAASFSLIASKYLVEPSVFLLLFGGTLFLYSFHRVYKFYVLKLETFQEKEKWMAAHKKVYFATMLLGFGLTIIEFIRLEVYQSPFIITGLLAAVISLLYVVRVRTKNLREVPYTKILWVTLTYVAFTSLLGFKEIGHAVFFEEWRLYLCIWMIVLGITIMFDVRDKEVDDLKQRTWPQLLGYRRSQLLSFILFLIGVYGLSFYSQNALTFTLVCSIVGVGAYLYVHKRPSELNYSFYFEGVLAVVGWTYYLLN